MEVAKQPAQGVVMSEEVASVFSTLKRTIRLSCLASSQHYLVLGAQTGSLYFFERFSFKFLQLIIFEDLNEPISLVSFAPDERLLAFATASPSRNIYLVSLPVRTRRKKDMLCIADHKAEIRCLLWATMINPKDGSQSTALFSADDAGIVCKTQIGTLGASAASGGLAPATTSSLPSHTECLYQADSRVTQLSYESDANQLMVSSTTCTAVLDFGRGQAFKVGTKARSGPYGASFMLQLDAASGPVGLATGAHSMMHLLLAARPGNRIWVAKPENPSKVTQTLNFQTSLTSTPPEFVFGSQAVFNEAKGAIDDVNFYKVVPFENTGIFFTWNASTLFVVDVQNLKIVAWYFIGNKNSASIVDVVTHGAHCYVLIHRAESDSSVSPFLCHLSIDFNGFLTYCLQHKDWARASYLLQKYPIEDETLLSSVEPFLVQSAVDKNIATEIGRLVQLQLDRLAQKKAKESTPSSTAPPSPAPASLPDASSSAQSSPRGSSTKPASSSPEKVIEDQTKPIKTDWSSFETLPTESVPSTPPPATAASLANSQLSVDDDIFAIHSSVPVSATSSMTDLPPFSYPVEGDATPRTALPQSMPVSVPERPQPSSLGASLSDVGEGNMSSAPVSQPSSLPSSLPTAASQENLGVSANRTLAESSPSVSSSPNKADAFFNFGSSTAPLVVDSTPTPLVGTPLSSEGGIVSSPPVNEAWTEASVEAVVAPVNRRKKRPKAVDIAAPSAKPPTAVLSSSSSLISNPGTEYPTPPSLQAVTKEPSLVKSPSSGHVAPAKASSAPLSASHEPINNSPLETGPLMNDKTPQAALSASASSISFGAPSPTPPSTSPTPSSTSIAPAAFAPLANTVLSTLTAALQANPTKSTSSASPALATPATNTPGSTSTSPSPSPTLTQVPVTITTTTTTTTTTTSTSLTLTTPVASPSVAPPAAPPQSVSSQPKVPLSTAELKQLGRDFKNKAKEGFKSFLSALPTPTTSNTPPSGMVSSTSSNTLGISTPASGMSRSPSVEVVKEFVAPPTSVQGDPVTRKAVEKLQHYRAFVRGREPSTTAYIYPTLKNWIAHYHANLESLPNAAQHLYVCDLFTACFEYEVSGPQQDQQQALEWDEKDAISFISIYLPSLRVSDVLRVANDRKWQELIDIILDSQEKEYETWKADKDNSNLKGDTAVRFHDRQDIDSLIEGRDYSAALSKIFMKSDLALILPYLATMFENLPKETVSALASRCPVMQRHNVEHLLSSKTSTIPTQELWLAYYKTLMERHAESRRDPFLTSAWVQHLLAASCTPVRDQLFVTLPSTHIPQIWPRSSPSKDSTSIEIPRRDSLLVPLDCTSALLLALKETDTYVFDRQEVLSMSLKHGCFKVTMRLLLEFGLFAQALELALLIDDDETFAYLKSIPSAVPAPAWPRVLKKAAMIAKYSPASAPTRIHPDVLVGQMSLVYGPHETIDLLTNSVAPADATESETLFAAALEDFVARLSPDILQQILADGMLGEQKKAVVASSLKSFDQNLFSKKSVFFSPQIANVEFIEKASVGLRENPLAEVPFFQKSLTNRGVEWSPTFVISGEATSVMASSGYRGPGLTPIDDNNHLQTFYGEHGAHWGVHLNFAKHSNCSRCGLPLLDPRAGKVALFEKCHHAFHEACVEEDACPECVLVRFDSLMPESTSRFEAPSMLAS